MIAKTKIIDNCNIRGNILIITGCGTVYSVDIYPTSAHPHPRFQWYIPHIFHGNSNLITW